MRLVYACFQVESFFTGGPEPEAGETAESGFKGAGPAAPQQRACKCLPADFEPLNIPLHNTKQAPQKRHSWKILQKSLKDYSVKFKSIEI